MKKLLALILFLLPAVCWGYRCLPQMAVFPGATGTPPVSLALEFGDIDYWWCPDAQGRWWMERRPVLKKYRFSMANPIPSLLALVYASDQLSAANALDKAAEVVPANAQEFYEYRMLRWQACAHALAAPPPARRPAACPEAPTPPQPAPAPQVWRVAPNGTSTTRPMWSPADVMKSVAERATVGALCDSSKPPVIKGTQTLLPLASGNLVYCIVVP